MKVLGCTRPSDNAGHSEDDVAKDRARAFYDFSVCSLLLFLAFGWLLLLYIVGCWCNSVPSLKRW